MVSYVTKRGIEADSADEHNFLIEERQSWWRNKHDSEKIQSLFHEIHALVGYKDLPKLELMNFIRSKEGKIGNRI